jgi:hypothetical protein
MEALATLYCEPIVISMNYYQSGRKIPVDKVVTFTKFIGTALVLHAHRTWLPKS